MTRIPVSTRELHTLLAALRFYQEMGQAHSVQRLPWIDDLATNGGQAKPLDAGDIDDLCERLNLVQPITR